MGSSQEEQLGAGKVRPARGIYGGLGSAAQAQLRPPLPGTMSSPDPPVHWKEPGRFLLYGMPVLPQGNGNHDCRCWGRGSHGIMASLMTGGKGWGWELGGPFSDDSNYKHHHFYYYG